VLRSRFVKLLSEVLFRSPSSYYRQDFVNPVNYSEKLLELPEIFFLVLILIHSLKRGKTTSISPKIPSLEFK